MTDASPPRRREPIFNMPRVVIACCVVLLGLYALYAAASDETKDWVIAEFAFVPARTAIALDLARPQLAVSIQAIPQDTFTALIGSGGGRWWTLLTYALLHGSWAHVGFNCIWLIAFGAPVARRFGAPRFLLLLIVAAIVGALVQFTSNMASFVPVIGASAAVSGAMGAAVRFVFRDASSAAEFLDRARFDAAFRQSALPLVRTLSNRAALAFIVFWLVTNLIFGLYPSLSGVADGPIAWQAHIGGFLTGLLLFRLFDPKGPSFEPDISAELPAGDGLAGEGEGPS